MGTQESQIFSKLKKRFCSGRKAFSEHGANALAKVCVLRENFRIEEIETPIPIDTSVEDWIKEIEEKVKANFKRHDARARENIEDRRNVKKGQYIPFIQNFLSTLYMCYKELDKRFNIVNSNKITKKARIEATIMNSLTPTCTVPFL